MAAREFSFTSFQANNPGSPPPGDRLDGEFDRLAKTIATLPPPSPVKIGKNQLEPGLFDQIGASILARVETLAAGAQTLLGEARTIALGTLAAAGVARAQNALAQDAAQRSSLEAAAAAASAAAAAASADQADAFYVETGNAARDTAGDVATCQAYADVTYAWAEHMPDPIPPNILAVMGITGDHWSSRWWANQAALAVAGGIGNWVAGSVAFATSPTTLGQDNANLFWNDSANRLGIGTATPLAKLQIKNGVGELISARFTTSDWVQGTTGSSLYFDFGTASGNTYSRVSALQQGDAAWNNLVLQSGGGNVGIGTTGPGAALTVSRNTAALPAPPAGVVAQLGGVDASPARMVIDAFGGGTNNPMLQFRAAGGTASTRAPTQLGDTLGNIVWQGYGTTGIPAGGKAQLAAFATQAWTDTATGTAMNFIVCPTGTATPIEAMRIDQNGNVGIGTASPAQKLDISGGDLRVSRTSGATTVQIDAGNSASGDGAVMRLANGGTQIGAVGNYSAVFGGAYNAMLAVWSVGNVAIAPVSGNVGIGLGSATPSQKLVVATATATSPVGILVSNSTESFLVGVEGSTTGASASGSIAYAAILNDASGHGLQIATGNTVRMTTAADGGVYIGNPAGLSKSAGTLNAVTVYGNNVVLTSDRELKTDIEPLAQALPIVAAIEPKTFRWKPLPDFPGFEDSDPTPSTPPDFTTRLNRGFLAQDVAKAIGGDGDTVDLGGLVAILWQAVREMNEHINALETGEPPPASGEREVR